MSFTSQTQLPILKNLPWTESFPGYWIAPVVFKDKIYLFYADLDGNNNINGAWYTSSSDGSTWNEQWRSCRKLGAGTMSIRYNTMPCPVVFNGILYVFYHDGGRDGAWFTTSGDGNAWTSPVSMNSLLTSNMSFRDDSSPTATVCNGNLFLFWINAGRTLNWAKFDGKYWGMIYSIYTAGVSVAEFTSVSATTSGEWIYLFYNNAGNDGTYMFAFNPVQNIWGDRRSLGNGFYPSSSPTAWTSTDGNARVACVWSGSGGDNMYFTPWPLGSINQRHVPVGHLFKGKVDRHASSEYTTWSSSCGAVSFQRFSYLFWWGSGKDGIWYSTAPDSFPQ